MRSSRSDWFGLILCASLVFFERGAVLFGALAVSRSALANAIGLTLVSGLTFLARSAAIGARTRRIEVVIRDELLDAAFRAVPPTARAHLRAALVRGVDAAASLRGRLLPSIVGDTTAAVVVGAYLLTTLHGASLLALAAGTAAAGVVSFSARVASKALARGASTLDEAAFSAVYEGLMGRDDIVAAGSAEAYRAKTRVKSEAWRRMQLRAAASSVLMGRGPALVAIAVGVGAYAAIGPPGGFAELAPGAAALFPVGGLLLAVAEWSQLEPRTRELRKLLGISPAHSRARAPEALLPVTLEALGVRFGDVRALTEVDALWARPSLVVVAGPNGSGKSTLLRAIVGLVPTTGVIRFAGANLGELDVDVVRNRVACLWQSPHLSAMATVREAMTFVDDASPDELVAALERVDVLSALRTHDREDPLSVSVDDLSGGERQRVALARALLRKDAELYLFDEPDANLDRRGIERVVGILEELSTRAVVIVAAHTEELIAAADVVVRLDAGRVVTPPAPADNPRSPAPSTKAAS